MLSVDELILAIIPVSQRNLTHCDIQTIFDFYASPAGRKVLQKTPAMMAESMQAVQPILQKHLPGLEARAEAAAQAGKEAETQPK